MSYLNLYECEDFESCFPYQGSREATVVALQLDEANQAVNAKLVDGMFLDLTLDKLGMHNECDSLEEYWNNWLVTGWSESLVLSLHERGQYDLTQVATDSKYLLIPIGEVQTAAFFIGLHKMYSTREERLRELRRVCYYSLPDFYRNSYHKSSYDEFSDDLFSQPYAKNAYNPGALCDWFNEGKIGIFYHYDPELITEQFGIIPEEEGEEWQIIGDEVEEEKWKPNIGELFHYYEYLL